MNRFNLICMLLGILLVSYGVFASSCLAVSYPSDSIKLRMGEAIDFNMVVLNNSDFNCLPSIFLISISDNPNFVYRYSDNNVFLDNGEYFRITINIKSIKSDGNYPLILTVTRAPNISIDNSTISKTTSKINVYVYTPSYYMKPAKINLIELILQNIDMIGIAIIIGGIFIIFILKTYKK